MKTLELKTAKCVEIEKYTEDDYRDMLNDCYGEVSICGYNYDAAYALEEIDPTAYRCGFSDFQEYEEKYECPECGELHDEEDDAIFCCQSREIYECEICGSTFEDEDECQECEDSHNEDVEQ